MLDNSRAENWLLDLVVTFRYPLCVLTHKETELLLNREGHGLSETELLGVLHRLFSDGLLIASRYTPDEAEVYFSPTMNEIKSGLNPREVGEEVDYGLTQEGGKIWEARSHPNWEKYLTGSYGMDAGEIISMDTNLARKALLFETRWRQSWDLISNPLWDVLSPWEATYWKTLPLGHRVRFEGTHFSEEQEQETPEESRQYYAALRQWSEERDSWRTRPW